MADDMDMSEWQVQTRGVSPWLLVLFIVLTIGGLLGCYFLYTKFAEAEKVTKTVLKHVKEKAEQPLKDAQIPEKLKVSPSSPVKYEKEFWNVVKEYLEWGAKYRPFAKTVGWPEETAPEDVVKLLSSASELEALFGVENLTSTTDLRAACAAAGTKLRSLQAQRATLQTELQRSLADVEATKTLMENQRKEQQSKINELLASLRKVQDERNQQRAQLQKLADQQHKRFQDEAKKVVGITNKAVQSEKALGSAQKRHENTLKAKDQQIAKLEQVEPVKPGPDGKIMRVGSSMPFAVINIGERNTVEKGEVFKVFEKRKGGKETIKGEVKVRAVKSRTSSVDSISEDDPLNPIIAGDYIKRLKPRRLHGIKVRADRRAKAKGR